MNTFALENVAIALVVIMLAVTQIVEERSYVLMNARNLALKTVLLVQRYVRMLVSIVNVRKYVVILVRLVKSLVLGNVSTLNAIYYVVIFALEIDAMKGNLTQ